MADILPFSRRPVPEALPAQARRCGVHLTRGEITEISALYTEMVIAGLCRSYAIDSVEGEAYFSFYSDARERPTHIIAKSVCGADGEVEYQLLQNSRITTRSANLADVLNATRSQHILRLMQE